MSEEVLYSASTQSGTHYEEAAPEEEGDPIDNYKYALYMKVGLFFGWSWKEFEETPLPVVEELSDRIDHRMRNFNSDLFLNWQAMAFFQAIAKAFGGKSE